MIAGKRGGILIAIVALQAIAIGLLFFLVVPRSSGTSAAAPAGAGSPEAYGAVVDDEGDDTAALQRAIDAVGRSGGGVVKLRAGTYRIGGTLAIKQPNVQLAGEGTATVLLATKPDNAVVLIEHGERRAENIRVSDLRIGRNADPAAGAVGLRIGASRLVYVDRVTIENAEQGISLGVPWEQGIPTQFIYIDNTIIRGTLTESGIHMYQSADVSVHRTWIEPQRNGIVMSEGSNGILIQDSWVISGGRFDYGIVSEGNGFARYIQDSIMENAEKANIYITGDSVAKKRMVISGNWIGAGDAVGDKIGILVDRYQSDIMIQNNRFGVKSGIVSSGSAVSIQGNLFEGVTGDSIVLMTGGQLAVQNNMISSGTGIRIEEPVSNYIVTGNSLSATSRIEDLGQAEGKIVDGGA